MLRWLRDLLFGSTTVQFPSDFGLEDSVRRLRAVSRKWHSLDNLFTQTAAGFVTVERVRIRRVRPYFHNGFQPYFVGHFAKSGDKAILIGRFTMHWWAKGFMCVWLGFWFL